MNRCLDGHEMHACVHCLDTRVVQVQVSDLDGPTYSSTVSLIRTSFNREYDVNLKQFDSVVMIQSKQTSQSWFGFSHTHWCPIAVMTVKRTSRSELGWWCGRFDQRLREEAFKEEGGGVVNLTNVCVEQPYRGQNVGRRMVTWYLNTLSAGTVVYLHVDKQSVSVKLPDASEEEWRDMVLEPVEYVHNGVRMMTPQPPCDRDVRMETESDSNVLGVMDKSEALVRWYRSMGFDIHEENEVEVMLAQIAHEDAICYDSADWKSESDDMYEDVLYPDIMYTDE